MGLRINFTNQGWGVAVKQVTIDPKDGSVLEEGGGLDLEF